MPVYNAVGTIRRSVDSILNQTCSDFEFIIIIECDTNDGTTDILEEYAKDDDRIRIIQKKEKKGISPSLNIGINVSSGKYIARMDADDYSYPERFETQLEFMEKNKDVAACGTQMRVISKSGSYDTSGLCNSEELRAYALFFSPLPHPTVFIRKDFIDTYNLRYIEEHPNMISEDYELWMQILDEGGTICNLDKVLLDYYYDGGTNLSCTNISKRNELNADLIKRRINKQFGIDTSFFSNVIFYPTMNMIDMIESEDSIINELYTLLSMIEEKNSTLMIYDKSALMLALVEKWNHMINFRYIMDVDSDLDAISRIIPSDVDKKNGCLFCDILARQLGVTKDNVIKELIRVLGKAKKIANSVKRVIVFGTGRVVEKYLPYLFNIVDVVAFCDNNTDNNGEFEKRPLIKPGKLDDYTFDHILIGSRIYYDEIKAQLIEELGIEQDKIVSIEILHYKNTCR